MGSASTRMAASCGYNTDVTNLNNRRTPLGTNRATPRPSHPFPDGAGTHTRPNGHGTEDQIHRHSISAHTIDGQQGVTPKRLGRRYVRVLRSAPPPVVYPAQETKLTHWEIPRDFAEENRESTGPGTHVSRVGQGTIQRGDARAPEIIYQALHVPARGA